MAQLVAAILAVVLGSFTGEGAMERAIQRGVRARLGRVKKVDVHVDRGHRSPFSRTIPLIEIRLRGFTADGLSGQPFKMGAKRPHGKIGRFIIRAEDFSVGGLHFEKMNLTITSIRFGLFKALLRGKLALDSLGEGTVSATFSEESLTRFAAPRITALRQPRLTLDGGRVVVEGKSAKLKMPVRFSATMVSTGGRVELADPDLHLWILPVPGAFARRVVKDINPLVDLNRDYKGPFQFRITQIPIANGRLAVRAVLIPRK